MERFTAKDFALFTRGLLTILLFTYTTFSFADLKVVSMNTLHLGYDSSKVTNYKQQKYTYIQKQVVSMGDVALLQEVMASADLSSITPNNYVSYPTSIQVQDLKGKPPTSTAQVSPYKEAYAAIAKPGRVDVICRISYTNGPGQVFANLIRPPDIVLIKANKLNNTPYIWLINFHAIWGKNVGERVSELNTVISFAQTTLMQQGPATIDSGCAQAGSNVIDRIILAGDFNLSTKQITRYWKQNNYSKDWVISLDDETTVNTSGKYSSNYDHFIISKKLTSDPQLSIKAERLPVNSVTPAIGSTQEYRQNISDHIGVILTISN